MQCPTCNSVNREGRKFCSRCGNSLIEQCTVCGITNEHDALYCGECGNELVNDKQQELVSNPSSSLNLTQELPQAERRQLTVMFCDLVGSTAMASRLDPEDLRAVIRQYQSACVAVIEHYGGFVARYMGDGIMVYFGYPQAHEEDAARAALAALEIIKATSKLKVTLSTKQQQTISVRIGIATGLVVVGDLIGSRAAEEEAVVGETPNLAARLQSWAEPNSVLISEATYTLVKNRFEVKSLGKQSIRGFTEKLSIWQIIHESNFANRFRATRNNANTKLVGREKELDQIELAWKLAQQNQGSVLLLSGEAGIGKSKLIDMLGKKIRPDKDNTRFYQCSPFHQNTPFFPFITQLESSADFKRSDSVNTKITKLEKFLSKTTNQYAQITPLYAALLSLPVQELFPEFDMSPQEMKEMLYASIILQMERLSDHAPLLIVLEDIHWIDPSALELANKIIPRVVNRPILFIISSRPEFAPPTNWLNHEYVKRLQLDNLSNHETRKLINNITMDRYLSADLVEQIINRADGIPLYIEELTSTMLEHTAESNTSTFNVIGQQYSIPTSLQDSLMARLDQNPTAKEIAQLASALGRGFSYELIVAVYQNHVDKLELGLQQLCDTGILIKNEDDENRHYSFRHALIQDAAYESVLKSRRLKLHIRIVKILEDKFEEITITQPEMLAYHCTRAGLYDKAIDYWTRAGFRSLKQCAATETLRHIKNGLDLLNKLDDEVKQAKKELELQILRGASWRAIKSFASSEVMHSFSRAYDLSLITQDSLRMIDAARGLYTSHYVRGEHKTALQQAEQILNRGLELDNKDIQTLGHYMLGASHFWCGALTDAKTHLEHALQLYDEQTFKQTTLSSQIDLQAAIYNHYSWTLWIMGLPEQALTACNKTLDISTRIPQAFTRAMAVFWSGEVLWCCGDYEGTEKLLRDLKNVTVEHSLGYMGAIANLLEAQICFNNLHVETGMEKVHAAFKEFTFQEAYLGMPWALTIQAKGYLISKDFDKGINILEEALIAVDKYDEMNWLAEIYRMTGEFHLLDKQYSVDNAIKYFNKAIEVAQQQCALSFELRAATSLAGLYKRTGDINSALQTLQPVLEQFSEGYQTRDLDTAVTLIKSLNENQSERHKVH